MNKEDTLRFGSFVFERNYGLDGYQKLVVDAAGSHRLFLVELSAVHRMDVAQFLLSDLGIDAYQVYAGQMLILAGLDKLMAKDFQEVYTEASRHGLARMDGRFCEVCEQAATAGRVSEIARAIDEVNSKLDLMLWYRDVQRALAKFEVYLCQQCRKKFMDAIAREFFALWQYRNDEANHGKK